MRSNQTFSQWTLSGLIGVPIAFSFILLSPGYAEAVLCPSQPLVEGCSVAGIGALRMTAPRNPDRRRISFRWGRGEELTNEDIGDPEIITSYVICVYDQIGDVPELVTEAFIPASSDWDQPLRAPGYRYDDFLADRSGIIFGRVKPGNEDRSKISFRGLGENVPLVSTSEDTSKFLNVDGFVTAQVLNDEGYCATLSFGQSDVNVNQKRRFKASFD
jgi:hypothetical protein